MLILPEKLRKKIFRHALASYPDECCGVMIGSLGADRSVNLIIAQENIEPKIRAKYRYTISPRELLSLSIEAQQSGLEILGFYHSHPFSSNMPSETDRLLAWPEYSYLIVSLSDKDNPQARSWRLIGYNQGFKEEVIG